MAPCHLYLIKNVEDIVVFRGSKLLIWETLICFPAEEMRKTLL